MLEVISASPGELKPVFDTMLANATRICEAKFGTLMLREGDGFRAVALHGGTAAYAEERQRDPVIRPGPNVPVARAASTKQVQHVVDMRTEHAYAERDPAIVTMIETAGARTLLAVPMLKDDQAVGAIIIYRHEVRPFTGKQIDLVKNFAAQAVIAIENTRLLSELRESLDQQTATSEVLKVISSSPGALEPVFQAMLENATRICEAKIGILWAFEDGAYRAISMLGISPAYAEYLKRGPFRPGPETGLGRVANGQQTVHIVDTLAEQAYADRDPFRIATAELGGARTLLNVPMFKEGKLIGAIGIYRQEVRPFTDKQIELVTNFAAQAVIAIENTRLLNELRELLAQQTATSEVLKVISSSPGALEPVFEAMLENATRICEAELGTLFLHEATGFRAVAIHGDSPYTELYRRQSLVDMRDHPGTPLDRLTKTKTLIHIRDLRLEQSYLDGDPVIVSLVETAGARTHLVVPMVKDEELVGAIVIYRQEVRPFGDKQIELVQNFAAQAVIAIENTRLLNELRQRTDDLSESLEQQTATSEVLRIISSAGGELKPVFEAMLENATRLCGAKFGNLYLSEGDNFRTTVMHNVPSAFAEMRMRDPLVRPEPGSMLRRVIDTRRTVQITDATKEQAYIDRQSRFVTAVELGGFRSMIAVPMLREDNLIGAIIIYRPGGRRFLRQADRSGGEFRRAGGDRHRERAAARANCASAPTT